MRSPLRRPSHLLLAFGGLLAALVALAVAWALIDRVSGEGAGATGGPAAAARAVDVRFRTIDGDSGRPLAGIGVRCVIDGASRTVIRSIGSDAQGLVTVRGVAPDASLSLELTAPAGYEAFPIEMTVSEAASAALGAGAGAGAVVGVTGTPRPAAPGTPPASPAAASPETVSPATVSPATVPARPSAAARPATAAQDDLSSDVTAVVDGSPVAAAPLPLYRNADQWLSWGRTAGRRRVGPAAGVPAGRPIWTRRLKYNIEYPPSLAYGMAIFGSYRGVLYGLRQSDGAELWVHRPGSQKDAGKFANQVAVSSWVEGSGDAAHRVARVFYANLNGVVGAVDAFTGEPVWRRVSGKASGTDGRTLVFRSFETSPLVVGETVYVASRYHKADSEAGLWALDRRTGLVRWFCKLGTSDRSKIGASPSYSRGRVFIASYDGSVFAVDAAGGRLLWRRFVGGEFYSTPTVVGSHLYIGNKTDGFLYCLRVDDGSTMWSSILGSSVYSSPAVQHGMVYVGTANDFVALSAVDGTVVWRYPTAARVFGSASVLGDAVYFSDLGHTYACDTRTGRLLWRWDAGRYSPVTATRDLIVVCGRQSISAFRPIGGSTADQDPAGSAMEGPESSPD